MDSRQFFIYLTLLTAGVSGLLAALHFSVPDAQQHGTFAAATVGLFLLICVVLYYAGMRAIRSNSKYAFTQLISVSVFGKMVLAMLYLLIYQRMAKPTNEWFVAIFLTCYLAYTAFEVWFMTRIAKWTAGRSKP
ncbi:MAG TPA: hypothetical protein PK971_00580 [Saprospiraceae bacterium]|nr:hypothetical protein [Saprospiraceae bacterium]